MLSCVHSRARLQDYDANATEFLLELGADVNQEVPGINQLGGTVLHALTAGVPFGASADFHLYDERRLPIIELLLRHGVSRVYGCARSSYASARVAYRDGPAVKRGSCRMCPSAKGMTIPSGAVAGNATNRLSRNRHATYPFRCTVVPAG